jgi:subtilisin family serine protease
MSNSWGGVALSPALHKSMATIESLGVLFVASAGNDGTDSDVTPHYPSSLPNANVISVGALEEAGSLWSGSNYGTKTV